MKSLIISFFLTITALFALSSCRTLDIRGQYVDDEALKQLENKKLTKFEVENLIGTPTIIPDYSEDSWYYIQRTLDRRAWLDPKVVEQRIVKVKFDKRGIIEEVTLLDDLHKDGINIISEYTKAYGTELNPMQKFVKNIGRFNKTTDGKKKQRK